MFCLDWEICSLSAVMAPEISIQAAAQHLLRHLAGNPWLTTVGVGSEGGQECLFIYASRLGKAERSAIPDEWEGHRVIVRKMNLPKPA